MKKTVSFVMALLVFCSMLWIGVISASAEDTSQNDQKTAPLSTGDAVIITSAIIFALVTLVAFIWAKKKLVAGKKRPLVLLTDIFIAEMLLVETALITAMLLKNIWHNIGIAKILIAIVILLTAFFILCHFFKRIAVILSSAVGIMLICLFIALQIFSLNSHYIELEQDKANVFSGHKVMLLVPHEDDDINVFGGMFEQYADYGSEVYTVFVTNGDYNDLGKTRINEAISCMAKCGVPEDHVIFLGYGDQWDTSGPHIYNAPSGVSVKSHVGYTETYATDSHPPYKTSKYTSDNYFNDIKSVILEYRPDVIYCVDYDSHIDHRAVSLAFEKVFGQILNEYSEYRPTVIKGFAYSTAWNTSRDFYTANILSTTNPYQDSEYMAEMTCYRWNDRLRLPVNASLLARSLYASGIYAELNEYASQNAVKHAKGIINGDKVFWERSTSSLSYTADMSVSSGNMALLNDFMLFDNYNLLNDTKQNIGGIWVPETDDTSKSATLALQSVSDIDTVRLYDNPSEKDNVLNAKIILDNGKTFETGPLDKYGAPTDIHICEKNVHTVTVCIEETEGSSAGLSEIELYEDMPSGSFDFVKLIDSDGNFAYDYIMPEKAEFSLYTVGKVPEFNASNYTVECSNSNCSAEIVDKCIVVQCPRGESSTLTIRDKSETFSDSIYVSNKLNLVKYWQKLENKIFSNLDSNKFPTI